MARRRFLYHLFSKNKKPYYEDDNGTVQEGNEMYLKPNGQPAHLKYSPIGWADTLIKYARNIKYWGIFRDMTVPMKFPKDGKKILNKVFWSNRGIETIVYLAISKLHPTILPYKYFDYYFSEIDFSKAIESKTDYQVQAVDGGMVKLFKANENTRFTIPIDEDPEHITLKHDGLFLKGSQSWIFGEIDYDGTIASDWIMGISRIGDEGHAVGVSFSDENPEEAASVGALPAFFEYISTSPNFFADSGSDNPGPIDVRVTGRIKVRLTEKRDTNFLVLRLLRTTQPYIGPGTPTNPQYYEIFNPGMGVGEVFTTEGEIKEITFDKTITMNPGDKLFTYFWITAEDLEDTSKWTILEGEMNAQFSSRYKETNIKGHHPWRVFELLCNKLVEGKSILSFDNVFAKSDWIFNKKDLFLTSGNAIRGLSPSYITTSISEYFKSMNHWQAGLGVEQNKVVIELLNYFNRNEIIADLGEVTDATYDPAEDLTFNTIKAGGPIVEYSDVNGKDEFTQEGVWTSPITRVIAELDLSTPYRRDPIGIELMRTNLAGQVTTDKESDTEVFMININPEPNEDDLYTIARPVYASVTGVLDPIGIYNLELSRKRTLLNNGSRLKSIIHLMDDLKLVLSSGEKNNLLRTEGGPMGIVVDEDQPIEIGSLGARIFLPYYINFTTKVPVNLLEIMNVNPYGKIRFKWLGRSYTAYLVDGGIKPATNDKQNWKVLSTVENDLSKFHESL